MSDDASSDGDDDTYIVLCNLPPDGPPQVFTGPASALDQCGGDDD